MARMVKSFFQGNDWKGGDTNVRAHRDHSWNGKRNARRGRLWHKEERGKKGAGWKRLNSMAHNMAAQRTRLFKKWQKDNPTQPNKKNPFAIPRQEFKTNAFAEAFKAAGIPIIHEQQEQHTEG